MIYSWKFKRCDHFQLWKWYWTKCIFTCTTMIYENIWLDDFLNDSLNQRKVFYGLVWMKIQWWYLYMIIHFQQYWTWCGHISVTFLQVLDRSIVKMICILVMISRKCSWVSSIVIMMARSGQCSTMTIMGVLGTFFNYVIAFMSKICKLVEKTW